MEALNLAALLERRSDGVALIDGRRSVTHSQLQQRVARWRGGLSAAGVGVGDRVVTVADSSEEFVAAHLATMGIGAVSVPLNPQSPPAELGRELAVVGATAAIGHPDDGSALSQAIDGLPGGPGSIRRVPVAELDAAQPGPVVKTGPDHPAALMFTSGTAGPPKAAILSHGNLTAGLQAILSLPVDLVGRPHTFIGVIPLFHIFGLNTVLHLSLLVGGTLVLGEFEGPEPTMALIEQHRVTIVAGPPTLWRALTRLPDAGPARFASVELAVSGAARLPPQLKLDVKERLGLDLSEGYGLTETSAVLAASIGSDAPLGSVGRLLPGVEARIIDEDGEDCLVGDPGELLVRGPMVFSGYWGEPDSGAFTAEGWLRTGDVVLVDDEGYLAIVDRSKDLVIVSGFNVFPAEVESVLVAHPAVAAAAVIGEPSEATGESVVAYVVPEEGCSPDEAELQRHCRRELARYKVPSRVVIAAELPVGPTGKLQRDRLA